MKQKLILIVGFILMLGLLVALNALSVQQKTEIPDTELNPNRSTYNTDSTGFHAFYTLLSETGRKVLRWQKRMSALDAHDTPGTFVIVGPLKKEISDTERSEILRWVEAGGKLVVIDRRPDAAYLNDSSKHAFEIDPMRPGFPFLDEAGMKEPTKDVPPAVPVQPTVFTTNVGSVQPSRFATYVRWPTQKSEADNTEPAGGTEPDTSGSTPAPSPSETFTGDYGLSWGEPVADLKSDGKAIVVDRAYGSGRIVILTDPFVLSNRGISLLDNAQLGVNLVASRPGETIAFDEYHHGFGSNENRLVEYFKGTPVVAIFLQLFLIAGLILFSQSRRFARPLPIKEPDRLTKLEYLSAMAELQRRTGSYDLAVENVYREFRRRASRLVGVDAKTVSNADLARLIASRAGKEPEAVLDILLSAEDVMHDVHPSRAEATRVVTGIRELEAALNLTRRKTAAK
ncbi:MAG: DUF4350 domain-containing protein [Acidobacteria bacterium ACB1]|nr:hypothetical protein [Pyrinomonadaceae bacterium]MCE7961688.1 DUF4350 domain-containing protein [Acidobacteria bacterium ACB1]